jgi:hypothetical protein
MMPADLEPGADEVRGPDAEAIAEHWVADWDRRAHQWRDSQGES